MGGRRARRRAPDVASSGRAAVSSGEEVAIVVRIDLHDTEPQSRYRYLMETLFSVIGVPYEFVEDGAESRVGEATSHQSSVISPGTRLTLTLSQGESGLVDEVDAVDGRPRGATGGTFAAIHPSSYSAHRPSPDSSLITHHSSLDQLFAVLARAEEYTVTARDQYGRFEWANTTTRPPEDAVRPLVSEYAQLLLSRLKEEAARAGLPFIRKEAWPGGKPMAACLTHDVDTVKRGKLPRGVTGREVKAAVRTAVRGQVAPALRQVAGITRTALGPNPYWTFDRISALERDRGFRSTYFVMAGRLHPEDAAYDPADPRMRRLMRTLADSGCEIGLHGSFSSFDDPASLRSQKARLETAYGGRVTGHRNHVLRFRVPSSWRAHQSAGLSYDATLGFASHEGFRAGHAFPFHPYDISAEQPLDLLEIPLAVMDVTLHFQKYRGLRGTAAQEATETVLEETLAAGGLATLLWHNDVFFDPEYPGCGALYEIALDWLADHSCWVATCGEIDRWWRARDAVVISPLPDDQPGWTVEAEEAIEGLVLRVSLPNRQAVPHVVGAARAIVRLGGEDYLLQFGRLAAGSRMEIRW